ncbi:MAG: hypothetical protein LH491_04160 [Pseudoxanthomonas sp.]|nr:hypothetical protein [Pseudoxanthomonas sp.]
MRFSSSGAGFRLAIMVANGLAGGFGGLGQRAARAQHCCWQQGETARRGHQPAPCPASLIRNRNMHDDRKSSDFIAKFTAHSPTYQEM